jgi:hypothetical protein
MMHVSVRHATSRRQVQVEPQRTLEDDDGEALAQEMATVMARLTTLAVWNGEAQAQEMVREMARLTTPAVCDGEAQVQEMARVMARGDEVDPSSRSDH